MAEVVASVATRTIRFTPTWPKRRTRALFITPGVTRTFAVLVNGGPDYAPDFLSENSQAVVVTGAKLTGTMNFAASDLDPLFEEATSWELVDAKHIVQGIGIDPLAGAFIWLTTPPPTGSIALTDQLTSQDVKGFYYETFSTGYQIRESPGGAGYMVVVTATFSR